jgi:hypothetical protein
MTARRKLMKPPFAELISRRNAEFYQQANSVPDAASVGHGFGSARFRAFRAVSPVIG